ncbi:MAG: hypothetical protein R6X16_11735 [Anaerolineae bacterium]
MEDWTGREEDEMEEPWQECDILSAAHDLAKRIACRSIPRGHMFRGRLFSERIAEMSRDYTNLEELLLELPECEEYQQRYGSLCCAAMVNLDDPERCTALDQASAILQAAASAAAVKKYRLWRMGVYD